MRRRRGAGERDVFGIERVALVTPEEAAALDAAARDRQGVPERVLMENAGRAAALVLDRLHPRGRITVLAGPGNNGGDAVVLARALQLWGREVRVFTVGSKPPDPALQHGHELPIDKFDAAAFPPADTDLFVDGILGTGARGAPRGDAALAIEALNASGRPVLALDLPSGVDATSGSVEGEAVRATATVTFGWPKIGLLFQPARSRCGRLIAVEIAFPPYAPEGPDSAALITPDWAAARLPRRPPSAHKGTAGRLLVLSGTEGMAGAAALACRAAQRSGTGLIRIASAASNRPVLQSLVPEATFIDRTSIDPEDAGTMHAVLAGPGIGTDDEARRSLDAVLAVTPGRPVVFDADALNLFARDPAALRRVARDRDVAVTPHPVELSRLTGRPVQEIVGDPPGAARAAAADFGCVVLLKGQPSIVASPRHPLLVNTAGSSDVASAGMGDQLSGVIGAMLAAGLAARDAAAVGLFFSARAADLAALGRSLSPADVSAEMHRAFEFPGRHRSRLALPFVTFDQPPRR
ncbi:MAG: NAD(P)H-hydrate dehydratase [Gemmatimonadota bacterium]|jgi:NAD(P)H-hydrate epimerase